MRGLVMPLDVSRSNEKNIARAKLNILFFRDLVNIFVSYSPTICDRILNVMSFGVGDVVNEDSSPGNTPGFTPSYY